MSVKDLFLNSAGRLRSGWRFLIFLFAYIFICQPVIALTAAFLKTLPPHYSENFWLTFTVPVLLSAILVIALNWLCNHLLENLPFRALGFSLTGNWLKDSAFGILTGAATIIFAALLAMMFGGLSFQINRTADTDRILLTLGGSLVVFVIGAVNEEALFRGFLLQTTTRAQIVWGGAILTSFLFASAHFLNPNFVFLSWLNTFLAGLWFAVAYLKTRNLWFPTAIHFAWNWFQGAFLGINVSGIRELTSAPILQAVDQGPTWLTGGHYGLEGGFACTVALVISTVLIWFLPFLKPTEEMMKLTSEENPKILNRP